MNAKKLGFLAASAFTLLAANAFGEVKTVAGKDGKQMFCQNAQCKGKSECGGAGNQCSGQNTCKGNGWVTAASKAECEKGGKGKWKEHKVAAADAPAHDAAAAPAAAPAAGKKAPH